MRQKYESPGAIVFSFTASLLKGTAIFFKWAKLEFDLKSPENDVKAHQYKNKRFSLSPTSKFSAACCSPLN